jgi:Protein of unknown function (DUF3105)
VNRPACRGLYPTGVLGWCYISPPVSSRQQEKQRRREERLARERAEKAKAARRKRAQIALGGGLGLAAIAAIVVLAFAGIGGDNGGDGGSGEAEAGDVRLPAQQIGELEPAAEEAGCELRNPRIEGRSHEDREFTAEDYQTNPPTSGVHFPQWSEDGVYETGSTPPLGMLVHTLEHGRINVQYKPGTPSRTVAQLEALLAESDGYHMLLYENPTGMDAQIAATAWGHSLTCPRMNDQVFDAVRTFTREYLDQGPEDVA